MGELMETNLPTDDEIRYHGLMRVWHKTTAFWSIGTQRHKAFQEVLALKDRINLVQLLLYDLYEYVHLCLPVLHTVVPHPPEVPEEMRGRVPQLIELWRKWGKDNGYEV